MLQRRRRDAEIQLRESVACLAAIFDQKPPLNINILAHREHALLEHRPHCVLSAKVTELT